MIEKIPLGGLSVVDLCRLNDTDPPLSFLRDLGIPPVKFTPTYQAPDIDRTTYWQPGGLHI